METRTRSLINRFAMAFCLLPVLWATGAFGASIEWQTMQGRERIVINKAMNEGMTGNATRVDANGIALPFNVVPGGLIMSEPPEGASIIKGTAQFGQTLAILTQTPKFGFVVSRQTPTQIIIDFFPDELGTRWKSNGGPGLAGQKPENAVSGEAQTNSATLPSETTPPSATFQSQPTPIAGNAISQSPSPTASATPTASVAQTPTQGATQQIPPPIPTGGAATPIGWKTQPVQTNAPVLTADGTKPVTTGEVPVAPMPVVTVPAEIAPSTPSPESILADGVLLDTRQDTAQRSAALPAPGLDVSIAGQQSQTVTPNNVQSAPRPNQQEQGQGQGPAHSVPVADPVATSPSALPVTQQGASPTDQATSENASAQGAQPTGQLTGQLAGQLASQPNSQADNFAFQPAPLEMPQAAKGGEMVDGTALLQGVGVRVQPGSYRGLFNPVGVEGIATTETTPPSPQTVASPDGPASAQEPVQANDLANGQANGQANNQANSQVNNRATPANATPQVPSQATPDTTAQAVPQSTVRLVADEQNVPADSTAEATNTKESHQNPEQATGQEPEQVGPTAGLDAPTSLVTDENVIYVNEEGEEIIPPADPVKRLEEIRTLITEKKYAEANELVTALLGQTNLSKEQREDALHIRAEMLFFLHRDNLQQYAGSIIEATDLAINSNSRSPKNAVALLRLGYVNLQLNNIPEAEARFNMLRRMFPNDENVPLSYYYWGDYFYTHDDLERAIDQFQVVTQKYPASRYAREASLGLARSFYRLGYYEQAFNIVEYIEQRWPRFYLSYPPFLNMMGDVAFRLNNFDFATRYYWLYVNLDPNGEEVDVILTRIGDIYSLQQQPVAAKEVYSEATNRFPESDGGLIALMRLAEESINDDPTIATMFNAFDSKPVLRPVDVYEKIIKEHPQSKYVSLAQLKLAMWYLWNHDYTTTLDMADAFLRAKPQDELAPKMKEVALKTFAILSAESVANGSFSRMRDIWERYPMLKEQEEILTPESRVALGVSYWKDGRPDDALVAVEPFFLGNKIPEYSEMALSLVLKIYLQYDQWPAIEEVGRRVSLWEISDDNQMQLDYALAYARENMNKPDEAAILWEKLYDSKRLPDDQMVYATYFLARDAEKRQRNDEAYLLGVEALKRLRTEAERNPEHEDTAKIKSQISSLMSLTEEGGRLGESLEYAGQYLEYLPENDPDRAAVLFRMGRINKKQGNESLWRERMTDIVRLYPDTVYGQSADAALKSTDLEKAASAYSPQR